MSKEFRQFRKSMEEATGREEERKSLKEIKDFYEKMSFEKKRKLLYKTLNSLENHRIRMGGYTSPSNNNRTNDLCLKIQFIIDTMTDDLNRPNEELKILAEEMGVDKDIDWGTFYLGLFA